MASFVLLHPIAMPLRAVRAYTPQREQTSRSCQSGTGVSVQYRAAISAGSGST